MVAAAGGVAPAAAGAGGAVLPIPNFNKRTASISTLPEELVVKILSYLPHFPGLTRCSTVSKKWHRLATCEELWKQVYLGEVASIATLSPLLLFHRPFRFWNDSMRR